MDQLLFHEETFNPPWI